MAANLIPSSHSFRFISSSGSIPKMEINRRIRKMLWHNTFTDIINPAKRKATSVQNEKRFLEQKRKAIQNPGHFPFQQAIQLKHKRHSNSL